MSSKERVKRPKLERTDPIRVWSTLFGIPPSDGRTAGVKPGAAGRADGSASLQDVMSRSVELGYRVVDEYIRQGQQAAQRISERSYGPEVMTNDMQQFSVRMAQHASDLVGIWFEMVQLAAGSAFRPPSGFADGIWPSPAAASPTRARPSAAPEGADHTSVKIAVASVRPTEVSLDLRPHAAERPLVVHALRAVDPDKPRLSEVSFDGGSAAAPATLRISVPADHPPGIYNGLIIDPESSRPVGSVSVRILAE